MAQLTFGIVEPIRFGTIEATPEKLTTETKLRLQALKFDTDAAVEEAKSLLSGVFGAKAGEVKAFMDDNMWVYDLQKLQTYLLNGMSAVEKVDSAVTEAMKEAIRKDN